MFRASILTGIGPYRGYCEPRGPARLASAAYRPPLSSGRAFAQTPVGFKSARPWRRPLMRPAACSCMQLSDNFGVLDPAGIDDHIIRREPVDDPVRTVEEGVAVVDGRRL